MYICFINKCIIYVIVCLKNGIHYKINIQKLISIICKLFLYIFRNAKT